MSTFNFYNVHSIQVISYIFHKCRKDSDTVECL